MENVVCVLNTEDPNIPGLEDEDDALPEPQLDIWIWDMFGICDSINLVTILLVIFVFPYLDADKWV